MVPSCHILLLSVTRFPHFLAVLGVVQVPELLGVEDATEAFAQFADPGSQLRYRPTCALC
eukprot:18418-Rhodomonas_salina.1